MEFYLPLTVVLIELHSNSTSFIVVNIALTRYSYFTVKLSRVCVCVFAVTRHVCTSLHTFCYMKHYLIGGNRVAALLRP